jgi:hypothetical protein
MSEGWCRGHHNTAAGSLTPSKEHEAMSTLQQGDERKNSLLVSEIKARVLLNIWHVQKLRGM